MESAYYEEDKLNEIDARDELSSRATLGKLLPLLKPFKGWLLFCLLLLAASKGIYLLGPNLIRHAIDVDIAGSDYSGLLATVGLYILAQALFLIINYQFRIRMEIIGQDLMTDLRKRLFDHVTKMAVSFFDRNPVGRLMSRVESDTEALRLMFTNTVVAMIGSVLLIVGMFIWMFFISARLALVVGAFLPLFLIFLYIYHRYTTPKWFVIRKRMADVTATLAEFLQGMQVIQIFDRAIMARKRLNEANRRKYEPELKAELFVVAMFNIIFFLEAVIISLVVYVGARWAGVDGLSIGVLVMFISYVRMFMEPVHMAAEEIAQVQKAVAGAKRIFGLLDTDETIPEPAMPRLWPHLETSIKFENIWFSYTDDDNYALKNVSFEIKRGQRIALVGITGGGKSTVINLLLRFNDPQKGRITVDGIDIRELSKSDLRAKAGLVLQDIYLFPGDIASNISLSSNGAQGVQETQIDHDKRRRQVIEACRTVAADQFIERMPDQYETELSERGGNLSRGERQLLSFARALAADPEVLILDEATSSVDPETERLIQAGLNRLMQGRTSIVIAHRLSTILNVDCILVVREGQIIERGNHKELLAQNGYYSKLFKLQFKQLNGAGVKKV